MKNFRHFFRLLFLLACAGILSAQSHPEPLDQSVYSFLQRMYVRGFHNRNLEVIPLDRGDIAACLMEIERYYEELLPLESDQLNFYLQEYSLDRRGGVSDSLNSVPWHLFRNDDSLFSVTLDPIIGQRFTAGRYHRYQGIKAYGTIGGKIGFMYHFTEHNENGSSIDPQKTFTPETGVSVSRQTDANAFEYSDIRGAVGVSWGWGSFTFGKDYVQWGNGQRGKLILSSKAPSFPLIRLDIQPLKWLRLYYLHGWLQSNVIDSLRSYDSRIVTASYRRNIFREKYLAAHMISVSPNSSITISAGESVVYSDGSPNVMFLNPLLFYRSVDHYMTHKNIGDGNNSQIFLNLDVRAMRSFLFYGTLFIDEISAGAIFNETKSRNQLGYTAGFIMNSDILPGVTVTGEYTRAMPWVYSNFIQTQTYENDGYLLGHYIGQNADQIFLKADYRFSRAWTVSLFGDHVRRGGLASIDLQYITPSLPFLYGPVNEITIAGCEVLYEPYFDVRIGLNGYYESHTSKKYRAELRLTYGMY